MFLLKKLSFDSLPSETNFIFIECEGVTNIAEKINSLLSENGIIVRQLHSYGLSHCLRITIGTKKEMEKTVQILNSSNFKFLELNFHKYHDFLIIRALFVPRLKENGRQAPASIHRAQEVAIFA